MYNNGNLKKLSVNLCTREKVEKVKKKVLISVESLLETCVSNFELTSACQDLSQADYLDVIQERNILNLCGYPLCSSMVKIPSKKYQICYKIKKVYDISERKCFCSNQCYKASNFLKTQLSDVVMWLQDEPCDVKLLADQKNIGSPGEEVSIQEMHVTIRDVNPQKHESNYSLERNKELLHDEIRECEIDFKDLVIKEREGSSITDELVHNNGESASTSLEVIETEETVGKVNAVVARGNCGKYTCEESNCSSVKDKGNSTESRKNDNKMFANLKQKNCSANKPSSVTGKKITQPPILIAPLPQKNLNAAKSLESGSLSLDQLHSIFREWITSQTLHFIYGNRRILLFTQQSCNTLQSICPPEKAEILHFEQTYAKLCSKLGEMEEDDIAFQQKLSKEVTSKTFSASSEVIQENLTSSEKNISHFPSQKQPFEIYQQKNHKRNCKQKENFRKNEGHSSERSSSTAVGQNSKTTDGTNESTEEPVLPLLESVSQNTVRQIMIVAKLRTAYLDLLPLAGLHYKMISDDVRTIVSTFRISSTNVAFRPMEWKAIALVLLRMLECKFGGSFCDQLMYFRLMDASSFSENFSVKEIDTLINTLVNIERFQSH